MVCEFVNAVFKSISHNTRLYYDDDATGAKDRIALNMNEYGMTANTPWKHIQCGSMSGHKANTYLITNMLNTSIEQYHICFWGISVLHENISGSCHKS